MATFAMGTAVGNFTAFTLNLGCGSSVLLFTALIAMPAVGRYWLRWDPILTFWVAYVLARPLGASIADGLAKPDRSGGMGLGDGPVALVLTLMIAAVVAYLAVSGSDVRREPNARWTPPTSEARRLRRLVAAAPHACLSHGRSNRVAVTAISPCVCSPSRIAGSAARVSRWPMCILTTEPGRTVDNTVRQTDFAPGSP